LLINRLKTIYIFYVILISFIFFDFTNLEISSTISLRIYQLFIPFLCIYLIFNIKYIKKIKFFEIMFVLFYFYMSMTFFWSIDKILSLKLIILQIMLIIFYFYLRLEFNKFTIKDLESLIIKIGKYYILGSLLFYIFGIYIFTTSPIQNEIFYLGLMQENILPRLRGFAESPNGFIVYALFFLIFFINQNRFFLIFLTTISLILSFSTTGWLLCFLVFFISNLKKISLKFIFSIFIIIVISVLIYILFIQNNEDIIKMIEWRLERNKSGTGRFDLWVYVLDLINNNIWGYGINTTRVIIADFHALNSLHNSILEVFLTGGWIGLLLYLLLYLSIFMYTLLIWKYHKDSKMFLIFVVLLVSGIANNTLHIGFFVLSMSILYQYVNKRNI
jgi:O-antigen ligase